MADMKCMKCGEPWDWWYIRDEVLRDEPDFQHAAKQGGWYKDKGYDIKPHFTDAPDDANWRFSPGPYIEECPACIGKEVEPDEKAFYRAAIAEILGDDIDGFIAECEDFGL